MASNVVVPIVDWFTWSFWFFAFISSLVFIITFPSLVSFYCLGTCAFLSSLTNTFCSSIWLSLTSLVPWSWLVVTIGIVEEIGVHSTYFVDSWTLIFRYSFTYIIIGLGSINFLEVGICTNMVYTIASLSFSRSALTFFSLKKIQFQLTNRIFHKF